VWGRKGKSKGSGNERKKRKEKKKQKQSANMVIGREITLVGRDVPYSGGARGLL